MLRDGRRVMSLMLRTPGCHSDGPNLPLELKPHYRTALPELDLGHRQRTLPVHVAETEDTAVTARRTTRCAEKEKKMVVKQRRDCGASTVRQAARSAAVH